jgi:hypothetical protein
MRLWKWIAVLVVLAFLSACAILGARRWHVESLPASAYSRPDQPTSSPSHVLLPESALADFKEYYFLSLGKPDQPTASWEPSNQQIGDLELHLPEISSLHPYNSDRLPTIQDPSDYKIQFLGIEMNGTRLIFLNAACHMFDVSASQWSSHLYMTADGWTCYWHALYNPITRQFTHLEINGRA